MSFLNQIPSYIKEPRRVPQFQIIYFEPRLLKLVFTRPLLLTTHFEGLPSPIVEKNLRPRWTALEKIFPYLLYTFAA